MVLNYILELTLMLAQKYAYNTEKDYVRKYIHLVESAEHMKVG